MGEEEIFVSFSDLEQARALAGFWVVSDFLRPVESFVEIDQFSGKLDHQNWVENEGHAGSDVDIQLLSVSFEDTCQLGVSQIDMLPVEVFLGSVNDLLSDPIEVALEIPVKFRTIRLLSLAEIFDGISEMEMNLELGEVSFSNACGKGLELRWISFECFDFENTPASLVDVVSVTTESNPIITILSFNDDEISGPFGSQTNTDSTVTLSLKWETHSVLDNRTLPRWFPQRILLPELIHRKD